MADPTATPIPDFAKRGGLVTAIAQDYETGEILMVASMNEESYRKTLELGEVVYWSTSRDELWHKGASSGNTQALVELYVDCDSDVVLVKVDQEGGACHTGRRSCFFRVLDGDDWKDVGVQVFDPDEAYGK